MKVTKSVFKIQKKISLSGHDIGILGRDMDIRTCMISIAAAGCDMHDITL
jgi:hypothetical protein